MLTVKSLTYAIDAIARRTPRGLSALTGEADPPTHDEIMTAALWTPSPETDIGRVQGGTDDERYTDKVAKIAAIADPIEELGWARLVSAAREVRELFPDPWNVYRMHVTYIGDDRFGSQAGGTIKKIAEKCGVSVATVSRWKSLIPRRIAKAAMK